MLLLEPSGSSMKVKATTVACYFYIIAFNKNV